MCNCTDETKDSSIEEARKSMPHPAFKFRKERQVINGQVITVYKPAPVVEEPEK